MMELALVKLQDDKIPIRFSSTIFLSCFTYSIPNWQLKKKLKRNLALNYPTLGTRPAEFVILLFPIAGNDSTKTISTRLSACKPGVPSIKKGNRRKTI
jgi:hypothetical protein